MNIVKEKGRKVSRPAIFNMCRFVKGGNKMKKRDLEKAVGIKVEITFEDDTSCQGILKLLKNSFYSQDWFTCGGFIFKEGFVRNTKETYI